VALQNILLKETVNANRSQVQGLSISDLGFEISDWTEYYLLYKSQIRNPKCNNPEPLNGYF
jgi:hypothetical protein